MASNRCYLLGCCRDSCGFNAHCVSVDTLRAKIKEPDSWKLHARLIATIVQKYLSECKLINYVLEVREKRISNSVEIDIEEGSVLIQSITVSLRTCFFIVTQLIMRSTER